MADFTPFDAERTRRLKLSFAARRFLRAEIAGITLQRPGRPLPGQLAVARLARAHGPPARLDLPCGRAADLYDGDEALVVLGNHQAEGEAVAIVPDPLGPCELTTASGLAGAVVRRRDLGPQPQLTMLGLAVDRHGEVLALPRRSVGAAAAIPVEMPILAVLGTGRAAGKTWAAARLVRGLDRSGFRVGAARVTGATVAADLLALRDAGARWAVDVADGGLASSYLANAAALRDCLGRLTGHLADSGAEVIVLDFADSLYQRETAALLDGRFCRARIGAILLAAGDAVAASAGTAWLRAGGLPVRALSGRVASLPEVSAEAAATTALPVLDEAALIGQSAAALLDPAAPSCIPGLSGA